VRGRSGNWWPSSSRAAGRRSARPTPGSGPGPSWADTGRRKVVDSYRLAYISEELVNWCPGLGTALANEEITVDGRSDIGNYPVYRRPLRQWMLRITAYVERLIRDPRPPRLARADQGHAAELDRPQRRRQYRFPGGKPAGAVIRAFTTRPDTLPGATYMVLAPEHPMVDELTPPSGLKGPRRAGGTRRRGPRPRKPPSAPTGTGRHCSVTGSARGTPTTLHPGPGTACPGVPAAAVAGSEQPGPDDGERHLSDDCAPRPPVRGGRVSAPVPSSFQPHLAGPGRGEGDLMELNGWNSPQMLRRYGASAR